jgi:hypothetical protein
MQCQPFVLPSICTSKLKHMKQTKTIIAVLAGICTASLACGQAAQPERSPGNKGFAVVELFTSEGCSSCPPADKLIQKIQQPNVYVLAFHVDYWDHQGWKDRFSAPEFTARQKQYADWLRLETIYTPQAVVNGATELVGSNETAMAKAIADEISQGSAGTLSLKGKIEGNTLHVDYEAEGDQAELVLALVQKTASSQVKAGENAGRSLSHVQIVRQLVYADIKNKHTKMMLDKNFNKDNYELVGMVQRKKDGHIIAATKINL